MNIEALKAIHQQLDPDVLGAAWRGSFVGEVVAEGGVADGLRIGHFQGDAALAAFVVAAHEACRAEEGCA
jgi:hypothetical protein